MTSSHIQRTEHAQWAGSSSRAAKNEVTSTWEWLQPRLAWEFDLVSAAEGGLTLRRVASGDVFTLEVQRLMVKPALVFGSRLAAKPTKDSGKEMS